MQDGRAHVFTDLRIDNFYDGSEIIWLPRMEQVIEMTKCDGKFDARTKCFLPIVFMGAKYFLELYMKKIYGWQWNGERWVERKG